MKQKRSEKKPKRKQDAQSKSGDENAKGTRNAKDHHTVQEGAKF